MGKAQVRKDCMVCVDGKIITARGAGVAVDFGLELVGAVCGRETQQQIRGSILCD